MEQELRCGLPGFELSYESETDQPYQGIIASTLSVYFINEGGSFDTWLQSIPSFVGERRHHEVAAQDVEGFKIEWAGVVLVDQVVIEDAPTPSRVQLVANDGTAQLKNVVPTIETGGSMNVNSVKDWLLTYLKETEQLPLEHGRLFPARLDRLQARELGDAGQQRLERARRRQLPRGL